MEALEYGPSNLKLEFKSKMDFELVCSRIVIFCFFGENYSTWLKSVTNDQKNDPIDSGRKAKVATGYTQGYLVFLLSLTPLLMWQGLKIQKKVILTYKNIGKTVT